MRPRAAAFFLGILLTSAVPVVAADTTGLTPYVERRIDFEGGSTGWTLSGQWSVTSRCHQAYSGTYYLAYVNPATCLYDVPGVPTAGDAVITLDIPAGVVAEIVFMHEAQVETTRADRDVMTVSTRAPGGEWTEKARWDSDTRPSTSWARAHVDVTEHMGGPAEVRFRFDTVDAQQNLHRGWAIENLEIWVYRNRPPVARAGADVVVGDHDGSGAQTVTLDGRASFDPEGQPLAYEWSEDGLLLGTAPQLSVDPAVGTHTYRLLVRDMHGAEATDTVQVDVLANRPPVPEGGADRAVANPGQTATVVLDGRASTDPDGGALAYRWYVGTKAAAEGALTSVDLANGTHLLTLEVTDEGGLAAHDTFTVDVGSGVKARFQATCEADRCVFDGTFSLAPGPIASTDYDWDLGTRVITGSKPTAYLYAPQVTVQEVCLTVTYAGVADVHCHGVTVGPLVETTVHLSSPVMSGQFEWGGCYGFGAFHYGTGCEAKTASGSTSQYVGTIPNSRLEWTQEYRSAYAGDGEYCIPETTCDPGTYDEINWAVYVRNADGRTSYGDVACDAGTPQGCRAYLPAVSGGWIGFTASSVDRTPVCCTYWAIQDARTMYYEKAPVARAGGDVLVQANGPTTVRLVGDGTQYDVAVPDSALEWWVVDGTPYLVGTGRAVDWVAPPGEHHLSLQVKTAKGTASDDLRVRVVPDAGVVARAGPDLALSDADGDGAEAFRLDGSASFSTNGAVVAHRWLENGVVFANTAVVDLTRPVGDHTFTLEVEDESGAVGVDHVRVAVAPNAPPDVDAGPDLTVSDADGDGVESVVLAGATVTDEGPVAVEWREGTAVLATELHAPLALAVGAHDLTLAATDVAGATSTDPVRVTVVTNAPPVADAGPDLAFTVPIGSTASVALDGTSSFDPDGPIVAYEWSVDGVVVANGATATVQLGAGGHAVVLRVVDAWGLDDVDDLLVVVEEEPLPPVDLLCCCVELECSFAFAPVEGSADVVSWTWDLGDGTTATEIAPVHAYDAPGTYTVTLTTTDSAGVVSTTAREVAPAWSPVRIPTAPPTEPHVRDGQYDAFDPVGPTYANVQSAWYEANTTTLLAAMKIHTLPERYALTSATHVYDLYFRPTWELDDPTWGGVAAGTPHGLRLTAVWPTGVLGGEPRYELHVMTTSPTSLFPRSVKVADVEGGADTATDIVWWRLPRSSLQAPPAGATIVASIAAASLEYAGEPLVWPARDEAATWSAFAFPTCAPALDGRPRLLGDEAYAYYVDEPDATSDSAGGSPAVVNGAAIGAGKNGGGFVFTAKGQNVDLPDAATDGLAQGTLAFWIRMDGFESGMGAVFGKLYPGVTREMAVWIDPADRRIRFITSQDQYSTTLAAATPLSAGEWTHVAFTWGPAGKRVYVDGVLDASDADTAGVGNRATVTCLAADCNNRLNSGLKGALDEIRVHRTALSGTQIHEIATRPYT